VIYKDPLKASKAFGDLFAGFGTIARHLPPPANSVVQILENAGDFFVNNAKNLIPELRQSSQRYKEYLPHE
jgi:hypothetical protein